MLLFGFPLICIEISYDSSEVWSRASLGLCLLVRFLLEASFLGDPSFGVLRRVSGVNPHLPIGGPLRCLGGIGGPRCPSLIPRVSWEALGCLWDSLGAGGEGRPRAFVYEAKMIDATAVWRDLGGPWWLPGGTLRNLCGIPDGPQEASGRPWVLGVTLWACWVSLKVLGRPRGSLVALGSGSWGLVGGSLRV